MHCLRQKYYVCSCRYMYVQLDQQYCKIITSVSELPDDLELPDVPSFDPEVDDVTLSSGQTRQKLVTTWRHGAVHWLDFEQLDKLRLCFGICVSSCQSLYLHCGLLVFVQWKALEFSIFSTSREIVHIVPQTHTSLHYFSFVHVHRAPVNFGAWFRAILFPVTFFNVNSTRVFHWTSRRIWNGDVIAIVWRQPTSWTEAFARNTIFEFFSFWLVM